MSKERQIEFGYHEYRKYRPDYEDIDWHELFVQRHEGADPMPLWASVEDELGQFFEQITQENCFIYLNQTKPEWDVVVVVDHRDLSGKNWWLTREEMGENVFNYLLYTLGKECSVISTKYPVRIVAQQMIMYAMRDIEDLDETL